MEAIRNLSGAQKGLLAGLILGILVIYACLCLAASGVIPLAPRTGRGQTEAQALAATEVSSPPDADVVTAVTEGAGPTSTSTSRSAETPPLASAGSVAEMSTPVRLAMVGDTMVASSAVTASTPVPEWVSESSTEVVPTTAPKLLGSLVSSEVDTANGPSLSRQESVSPTVAVWMWQGIEYERTQSGSDGAILAVRIVGVPGRKVIVREETGGWSTTLVTGQKPEYGDFSDAVGGLKPATYVVKPMDMDASMKVRLGAGEFVLVEFALRPSVTQTTTLTSVVTSTLVASQVISPTMTPSKRPMIVQQVHQTPAPTATLAWVWRGIEYERIPGSQSGNISGIIAVRIVGVPDRTVLVREVSGGWSTTLTTGRKPQYGDFSDDVGGLQPGTYTVKPMDIDDEVTVHLNTGDFVLVEFAPRPPSPEALGVTPTETRVPLVPTGATVVLPKPAATPVLLATSVKAAAEWEWRPIEWERVPGAKSGSLSAVLAVRVVGVPNRTVLVREVTGGWTTTLVTGRKPEYGDFADAVGGLPPGSYFVKVEDIDAPAIVVLEQGDFVLVEWALRPPKS